MTCARQCRVAVRRTRLGGRRWCRGRRRPSRAGVQILTTAREPARARLCGMGLLLRGSRCRSGLTSLQWRSQSRLGSLLPVLQFAFAFPLPFSLDLLRLLSCLRLPRERAAAGGVPVLASRKRCRVGRRGRSDRPANARRRVARPARRGWHRCRSAARLALRSRRAGKQRLFRLLSLSLRMGQRRRSTAPRRRVEGAWRRFSGCGRRARSGRSGRGSRPGRRRVRALARKGGRQRRVRRSLRRSRSRCRSRTGSCRRVSCRGRRSRFREERRVRRRHDRRLRGRSRTGGRCG